MGCDIHFFAEHRKDKNSLWEFLPAPNTGYSWEEKKRCEEAGEEYISGPSYRHIHDVSENCPAGFTDRYSDTNFSMRSWFDSRNYYLFSVLAGVRGNQTPILKTNRGWPEDCCEELFEEEDYIEHTPCWLTVREMQDHFEELKKEKVKVSGVIDYETMIEYLERRKIPTGWSKSVHSSDILTISDEVFALIDRTKVVEGKIKAQELPLGVGGYDAGMFGKDRDREVRLYIQTSWYDEFDSWYGTFVECLDEMQQVSGRDPSNIRAVFYFDS